MTRDYKLILTDMFSRIEGFKTERPSAGTKFRLMGMVADIVEVAQTFRREILEKVSQEAVLDADADIDFVEVAEKVLGLELTEHEGQNEELHEQILLANEALGELHDVMEEIAQQLERHHSDAEFVRLYENEKRRYIGSGTYGRARKTFDEWKENQCYGTPSMEEMDDYRLEKVILMFEKGVFRERVEHLQRAKRYPGELDFEQLTDNAKVSKTVFHHYAVLRKLVDWKDGALVVNPARVGQYFYAGRHEDNAKSNRTNFLKYMHKVSMVQEERSRMLAAEAEAMQQEEEEELNLFAPTKNLKVLLSEEWFGLLATDEKRFDRTWTNGFVDALMQSEWGGPIARDWAVKDKRLALRYMVVGLLKDAGVLRGSYNQIAKLVDLDGENAATLAKYMGLGKKQPYADWVTAYVKSD